MMSMIAHNDSFFRPAEQNAQSTAEKDKNRFSPNNTLDLSAKHHHHHSNSGNKKSYFRHSLTGSEIKALQKMTPKTTEREARLDVGWGELYNSDIATFFAKLCPYAQTPPRPIFSKESQ